MANRKEVEFVGLLVISGAFVSNASARNIRTDYDQCYAAIVFKCGMRVASSDFESSKIRND